jgi:uroporphyrinogen III methyltransferase / synthase
MDDFHQKYTCRVYLVGAGPGDPGLLTLRGAECLARAQVVLYDYLVNPQILRHAGKGAELVCLGRHGSAGAAGHRLMPQDEINRLMIEHARAGRVVVRLKGGDPAVFARAAEETYALEEAGIAYEIIPGITAALAAGSHAGIPITHGDSASALAIVTGQERGGKADLSLDFAALASFPGTLVFYMGVTTARDWTASLISAGKPAETPAAIIRRCSWPDQQTVRCTLGEVADRIEATKLRPPVIVVVGTVATVTREENWFTRRPLFGKRVMVTRPVEQADALVCELNELGAEVLMQPAIKIGPPPQSEMVDAMLDILDDYDWVVFSSANGVRAVAERLLATGRDMRAFGKAQIAAIGPGTAEELNHYHLRADRVPNEFRAEALAASLAGDAAGKRFLLVRASRGREVLSESLQAAGGNVVQVVAYTSSDVPVPNAESLAAIDSGHVDWIMVTSSAIARSLVALFGEKLRSCKLASISPLTSETLARCGFPPTVEAGEYTISGVVAAIVSHERRNGKEA